MLRSPYTPGSGDLPAHIAGRDAEIQEMRERIGAAAVFREWAGAPVVYSALRGLGKTVLLRHAEQEAVRARLLTGRVTCEPGRPVLADLASALRNSAAKAGFDTSSRWSGWMSKVQALTVEAGLAGVRGSVELRRSETAPEQQVHWSQFAELVVDLLELGREAGRPGLALLVDETQEAPLEDLRSLAYLAQDFAGDGVPVVVLMGGLPQLPELFATAASFAERFSYRTLVPLSPAQVAQALTEPADSVGVHWDGDAVDYVAEASQGHPYLVQLYGGAAWRSAAPQAPGERIAVRNAQAGVEDGMRQLEGGLFRARWMRTTGAERNLLRALARWGDGTAPAAAVAAAMGRTRQQISAARASLIAKGIVHSPQRARLQMSMPGFAAFVAALEE